LRRSAMSNFFAHVLVGKPVPIPDHVRDKPFRDMLKAVA
jgi:hypothetical protein